MSYLWRNRIADGRKNTDEPISLVSVHKRRGTYLIAVSRIKNYASSPDFSNFTMPNMLKMMLFETGLNLLSPYL